MPATLPAHPHWSIRRGSDPREQGVDRCLLVGLGPPAHCFFRGDACGSDLDDLFGLEARKSGVHTSDPHRRGLTCVADLGADDHLQLGVVQVVDPDNAFDTDDPSLCLQPEEEATWDVTIDPEVDPGGAFARLLLCHTCVRQLEFPVIDCEIAHDLSSPCMGCLIGPLYRSTIDRFCQLLLLTYFYCLV